MKPLKQLNKHDPDNNIIGDCFRACVCSVLEIENQESVPNFCAYPADQWWGRFIDWAKSHNLNVFWGTDAPSHIDFYIVTGTSPRGFLHSVIYSKGVLIHDPHPDGGDVVNIIDYVWLE